MAVMTSPENSSGPYEQGAPEYLRAGWPSILPLPPGAKYPPPEGYTGAHNVWTSAPDVYEWIADRGDSNVALRLPDGVIGIDVDAYPGKHGGETLRNAMYLKDWGELPATWRSTSRDDGVSGIYLFTTPLGLWWPSQVGPDIEIIQRRHRYTVVWPSVHPAGGRYHWITSDGLPMIGSVPAPTDLAELPARWVNGLTGGRTAGPDSERRAVTGALLEALFDSAPMCRVVRHVLAEGCTGLAGGMSGSRHDTGARVLMHLFRLRSEGHAGLRSAVEALWAVWSAAVLAPGVGQRDAGSAEHEWLDLVKGAAALVSSPTRLDPCADDLRGILAPGWTAEPLSLADWTPAPPGTPVGREVSEDALSVGPDDAGAPETVGVDPYRAQLVQVEAERIRIRAEARALVEAEQSAGWVMPESASLADWLIHPVPEPEWVVGAVLPKDGNVLLTAQFKSGKTTLVNHLTHCLVDGGDFLGVHPGDGKEHRVALWNYEVSASTYVRWLADLGIKNTESVHVFNLRGKSMPLVVQAVEDQIVQWMIDRGITDWVVDPFARAFVGNGENENSNSEVGIFTDRLDRIKDRAGINTLILPAHTGRTATDVGSDRARGATRLDDWCDVRWLLTTQIGDDGINRRYFRATGRDVEVEETEITMDPITRRLMSAEGRRERSSSGGSKRGPKRNLANEIIAALTLEPGLSQRAVRDAVGARGQDVTDTLGALASQGVIRVDLSSGNGRPSRYYMPDQVSR